MSVKYQKFMADKGFSRALSLFMTLTCSTFVALSLFLSFTGTPAQAQVVSPSPLENSPYDAETFKIADQMQCPVCQGQTVAFSNSGLSQQMRTLIKKKLEQGEIEQQILQYFVDRYGEGILTNPPKSGFNLVVWLLPILGLVAGTGVVGYVLRNWHGRKELATEHNLEQNSTSFEILRHGGQAVPLSAEVWKAYEKRVELELTQFEGESDSNTAKADLTATSRNVISTPTVKQSKQQAQSSEEQS